MAENTSSELRNSWKERKQELRERLLKIEEAL
jgi:hypothetical protein